MIANIIEMLDNEEEFDYIFKTLKCTDKEFLEAISTQQEMEYTTVIHNDPNYNFKTVAY